MGQLVELVFEDVALPAARRLVRDILGSSSGASRIDLDGEHTKCGTAVEEILGSMACFAWIQLSSVATSGASLPNVGLRLLKTRGESFDVELNFDLDDVKSPQAAASALHHLARELASRHGVVSYFAGLEPAVDMDTRLFTGETEGPLRLPA